MRAKLKVCAIGINILPSTPLRERIGIKTIRIINCPKMAEFIIFEELFTVSSSFSICLSEEGRAFSFGACLLILKATNSTMITAPSMIIPKSMAPILIKLASTPKRYIIERVKSSDSGITEATTSPERKFPNKSTTTKITISTPKMRFSAMVKVVFPMSTLLSRKGLMYTPSGRDSDISATRSCTSLIT